MKILVTGADGYIGSVLSPKLLARGHEVVGLDAGFYRRGWLFEDMQTRPVVFTKDIRLVQVEDLRGFDAVIHLAELSNDPLGEIEPEITMAINHRGSVALAWKSRDAGVGRFIYASSCSIYGAGGSAIRTETSGVDPQTAYARCKVLVERDIKGLTTRQFTPVFLRNATAYGASPRQRFDLVLNNLAGFAWTEREIRMTSDGSPWRPIVHIEDICNAVVCALEAPRDAVAGHAFNVGADEHNFRVREIAEVVAAVFPGCQVKFGQSGSDVRSYRVSFEKIRSHMPEFRCEWDAARGASQLRMIFERICMTTETFSAEPFTRLKELNYLRRTGQLTRDLFWTTPPSVTRKSGQPESFPEMTETGRGHLMENAGSS